jgi:hypothetical protein
MRPLGYILARLIASSTRVGLELQYQPAIGALVRPFHHSIPSYFLNLMLYHLLGIGDKYFIKDRDPAGQCPAPPSLRGCPFIFLTAFTFLNRAASELRLQSAVQFHIHHLSGSSPFIFPSIHHRASNITI